MPNLSDPNANVKAASLVKALILGDTKAGKTHWAMQAAEAGFNVLYINGDVALQTLLDKKNGLSPAALGRVSFLEVRDYVDDKGNYVPFMAKFFVDLATQGVVTWNDTKGRLFNRNDYEVLRDGNPTVENESGEIIGGDEIWEIKTFGLGPMDVLILDSWTTLIASLQQWKAQDLGIDLLDIEKMERDMYSGTAHKATQFLQLMQGFKCHVIVIGHPREYQKKSPPPGSKGVVPEKDMKLDWSKMVPVSTSNPHAYTMGKNFSDIGWIEVNGMGKRMIDFKPTDKRVQGGHLDERDEVHVLTFKRVVEAVGGRLPDGTETTSAWLRTHGPGQYQIAGSAKKPLIGSNSETATPVKVAPIGLAGLMNRKKP